MANTSIAISTQGMDVEVDPAGGTTYTDISDLIETMSISGATNPEIDVTVFASTAKEYLTGLGDSGTLDMGGFYTPGDAGATALKTLAENSNVASWKLTFSNGYTWSFDGAINSFNTSMAKDDAVRLQFGVKISGAITEASGT